MHLDETLVEHEDCLKVRQNTQNIYMILEFEQP